MVHTCPHTGTHHSNPPPPHRYAAHVHIHTQRFTYKHTYLNKLAKKGIYIRVMLLELNRLIYEK